MAKRIAAIWFALLVLILMAGMVAAQERLSQADRKAPPNYQEPSGHAAVLCEQAGKFMKAEEYANAAAAYKQITRLRPDDFAAYTCLGFANMMLGRDHQINREVILNTVRNIVSRLRQECLKELKWPYELNQASP